MKFSHLSKTYFVKGYAPSYATNHRIFRRLAAQIIVAKARGRLNDGDHLNTVEPSGIWIKTDFDEKDSSAAWKAQMSIMDVAFAGIVDEVRDWPRPEAELRVKTLADEAEALAPIRPGVTFLPVGAVPKMDAGVPETFFSGLRLFLRSYGEAVFEVQNWLENHSLGYWRKLKSSAPWRGDYLTKRYAFDLTPINYKNNHFPEW